MQITRQYTGQGLLFFIGKTMGTLEKNVLLPMEKAYPGFFSYNKSAKTANLCGIRIELEGCNDVRAESKIRGTTAEGIYGDELTLWNIDFMTRCMGSLRVPGAWFLGTTKPDDPGNFVKTDYIDRAAELNLWNPHFTMDDNPSLTEEYKKQVSREYTGIRHDRFIKGLWRKAEGLVFPKFAGDAAPYLPDDAELWEMDPLGGRKLRKRFSKITIGADFGGNGSKTCFFALGYEGYNRITGLEEAELPAGPGIDAETICKAYIAFAKRILGTYGRLDWTLLGSASPTLINSLVSAAKKAEMNPRAIQGCRSWRPG